MPWTVPAGFLVLQAVMMLLAGSVTATLATVQAAQRAALSEAYQRQAAANARLQQYAATLEELATSRERNRLARELHDTLAHSLSAVTVQLEAVRSLWARHPDKALRILEQADETARTGLAEARRALQALRASPLEDLGLPLPSGNLRRPRLPATGAQLDLRVPDRSTAVFPERRAGRVPHCAGEPGERRPPRGRDSRCGRAGGDGGRAAADVEDDGQGIEQDLSAEGVQRRTTAWHPRDAGARRAHRRRAGNQQRSRVRARASSDRPHREGRQMVRVLICDDQTVVRDGLEAILSTDDEIEVVGAGWNGQEAVDLVRGAAPGRRADGPANARAERRAGDRAAAQALARHPGTGADDVCGRPWVLDAMRAGAAGYLLKDTRRDDLVAAIKGTAAGKTFVDPAVAGKLLAQVVAAPAAPLPSAEVLTERESACSVLICRGYSNPEIAQQLHLAPGTVRNYVSSILQKLGVEDRTQAAVVAYQRGLVKRGELR